MTPNPALYDWVIRSQPRATIMQAECFKHLPVIERKEPSAAAFIGTYVRRGLFASDSSECFRSPLVSRPMQVSRRSAIALV